MPVPEIEVDEQDLERIDDQFIQDGQPFSGVVVSRYPNAQVESRRPCLHGMPHGICRDWYPGGQLQSEWACYRGMGHGWAMHWHSSGQLAKQSYVQFGRPLEWTEYDESGREIQSGSNRGKPGVAQWMDRCRKAYPDAP